MKQFNHIGGRAIFAAIVFLVIGGSGCTKEYSNQIHPNTPPQTFFWLSSDSAIAPGISKQEIRWWGEDVDGYIVGYLVALDSNKVMIPQPDTLRYSFTTATDSVIIFPLQKAQQTFLVAVRAIDNTFTYRLPVGAQIRLSPFPYWDKNENGVFDSFDARLDGLSGAIDSHGASQQFPTKNTPPTINYVYDQKNPLVYAQPPITTFPVASFSWVGHDFDGDNTIKSYKVSLNDSTFTNSLTFPATITTVTLAASRTQSDAATSTVAVNVIIGSSPNLKIIGSLSGLRLNANNSFYVQAIDIAGGTSPALAFPSLGRKWYVKKPQSDMLIVNDYIGGGDSMFVRMFYDTVFANATTGSFRNPDVLKIRADSGAYVPSFQHINPAMILTLQLYKYVYWYTDGTPSLSVARFALFDYLNSGGKLVYSTLFNNPSYSDVGGAFRDFAPIDSVSSIPLSDNKNVLISKFSGSLSPDSSIAGDIFPVMRFKTRTSVFVYPLYDNSIARGIYYLPADTTHPRIEVATIDGNKSMIFFGFALYNFSSVDVTVFIKKSFNEFGLQ